MFDNYINNLLNAVRYFMYFDGPSLLHFRNLTMNNVQSKLFYNNEYLAGLSFNAFSVMLINL